MSVAELLEQVDPSTRSAASLDRELLERWLADTAARGPQQIRTRISMVSGLGQFLIAVRRHGWAPALPAMTEIHPDDYPRRPALAPRFLSEHVMAQLENEANLAHLKNHLYRLITRIIIGTGLRQGDARQLSWDCLIRAPQGAPYLRYTNHKMKREAVVPIDADLAARIEQQKRDVLKRISEPVLLLPRPRANLDGQLHLSPSGYNNALIRWLRDSDIRDEDGVPSCG